METPGKIVPRKSADASPEARVQEAAARMDAKIAYYQGLVLDLSQKIRQLEGAEESLNTKPFVPYTNEINGDLFKNMSESKRLAKLTELYKRDLGSIEPLLFTMQESQREIKRKDMGDAKFEEGLGGSIRGANEHGNVVVESLAQFTVADFYASATSWKASYREDMTHELVPAMVAPGSYGFTAAQAGDIARRGKDYLDVLQRQMLALTKAGGAKDDYVDASDMKKLQRDFSEVRKQLSGAERAASRGDLGAAYRMTGQALALQQVADENYNKVIGEAATDQYVHEKANWYTKIKYHVTPWGDGIAMASPLVGAGIGTLIEPGGGTAVGWKVGADVAAGWWAIRGIDGVSTCVANNQVFSMECAQNLAIIALSASRIPTANYVRGIEGASKVIGAGLLLKTSYDVATDLEDTAERGWFFTSGQKKQYLFYGGMFVLGAVETAGMGRSNTGIFTKALGQARMNLEYSEIPSIWSHVSEQFKSGIAALEVAYKNVSPESRALLEKGVSEHTFLVLDKGKTWLLNNLGKDFGDLGLKIYFEAIDNVAGRFSNKSGEGANKAMAWRTTAEGDEAVFVLSGENAGRGQEIARALKEEMARLAKKYGIGESSLIYKAITDVSSHEAKVALRIENGGVKLYERAGEGYSKNPVSLDEAVMNAEVRPLLGRMPEASRAPVERFMATANRVGEMLGLRGDSPEKVPKAVQCERHLQIRFTFDARVSETLLDVAETARKAVSQVKLNMVGPSLLNLMGHRVTDALNAAYFEILKKSVAEAGIDAEIYSMGPMSFGFKGTGKTNWARLDGAVEAASREFTGLLGESEARGLGITGVDYATGMSKWEAGKQFINKLPGMEKMTDYKLENVRNAISILNIKPGEFVNDILSNVSLDIGQRGRLRSALSSLPEWAREETGIYWLLKLSGLSPGQMSQVFDNLQSFGSSNRFDIKEMADVGKVRAQFSKAPELVPTQ